jgi:hypothetical protein
MKRRAFQIFMLLILGAIVNIAVAWGFAVLIARSPVDNALRSRLHDDYLRLAKREFAIDPLTEIPAPLLASTNAFREVVKSGYQNSTEMIGDPAESTAFRDARYLTIHTHSCGFPVRALRGRRIESLNFRLFMDGTRTNRNASVKFEFAIPLDGVIHFTQGRDNYSLDKAQKLLPLRPIWPGFVINTLFYATILWVMWFVSRKVKRTLRGRRGVCQACSYPIGTSPVCTECGANLLQSRTLR